jgi:hypothetical protein
VAYSIPAKTPEWPILAGFGSGKGGSARHLLLLNFLTSNFRNLINWQGTQDLKAFVPAPPNRDVRDSISSFICSARAHTSNRQNSVHPEMRQDSCVSRTECTDACRLYPLALGSHTLWL